MNNTMLSIVVAAQVGLSSAATITNRETIVIGCLEQLACDIVDDFDESTETQDVDWVSWTEDGFFGRMSTNLQEHILYRQAFDSVLEQFATNDWNTSNSWESPFPKQEIARIALCQIRDMSYTNAISIAKKWALNASAPYRDEAIGLYFGWSKLDAEMLNVANSVLTNAICASRSDRFETFVGMTARIDEYIRCAGKDACYSNAVHTLYQSRTVNVDCAAGLDSFFVSQIDGYELSSNRLETVRGWLESTNCTSEVRAHCAAVTNQLMTVGHPLAEVESLRGL